MPILGNRDLSSTPTSRTPFAARYASSASESAATTNAPAMTAGQETPDEWASFLVCEMPVTVEVYAIIGLLAWTLVNHLRAKQTDLARSLIQGWSSRRRLRIAGRPREEPLA